MPKCCYAYNWRCTWKSFFKNSFLHSICWIVLESIDIDFLTWIPLIFCDSVHLVSCVFVRFATVGLRFGLSSDSRPYILVSIIRRRPWFPNFKTLCRPALSVISLFDTTFLYRATIGLCDRFSTFDFSLSVTRMSLSRSRKCREAVCVLLEWNEEVGERSHLRHGHN